MESLGWTVSLVRSRQQTPDGEVDFVNVVATLDPKAKKRMVNKIIHNMCYWLVMILYGNFKVIACHYDSKTLPAGFIGATDSAVPCAQIVQIASKYKAELGKIPKVFYYSLPKNNFSSKKQTI